MADVTPENKDYIRWGILNVRRAELLITKAFSFFREHQIEPILIKGWAANRFYPEDDPRAFYDTDLAVSADDYDAAYRLIHSSEGSSLGIDLHRETRHLDTLPWDDLFARCELIDLDGVSIRVPCAEDNLRIQCVHWLNDGAEYKQRLWDIYYSVLNRPASFDWEKCFRCVSTTRQRWIIVSIGLAHRYLELPIDDLPFADEARQIPPWIIKCVEREWKRNLRLSPLQVSINRPKQLLRQIKKRLPPNPIQATVDMEGEFDNRSRVFYQIGSILKRLGPSLKRNTTRIITGKIAR